MKVALITGAAQGKLMHPKVSAILRIKIYDKRNHYPIGFRV